MPKVTLLKEQWSSYSLAFGKGMFSFQGGETVNDVPVAVALELQKRKDQDGSPLFKVSGLPRIVEVEESAGGRKVLDKQNDAKVKKAGTRRSPNKRNLSLLEAEAA